MNTSIVRGIRPSVTERYLCWPIRAVQVRLLGILTETLDRPLCVTARTFWGEEMILVLPDIVSGDIFTHGFFEEGLTTMIIATLKKGDIFFDVGAHFGYFSLLASRIVGDNGQVHSFEPTECSFRILERNVAARKNVKINKIAVYSERTKVKFNDYGLKFSALNSLYAPRSREKLRKGLKPRTYFVDAMTVDEYVDMTGAVPNFVKIDAESAEYDIVSGMGKTIKTHYPTISIEVGDEGIEGVKSSKELIEHVTKKGYVCYEYSRGKMVEHEVKERYEYDNILFLPRYKRASAVR